LWECGAIGGAVEPVERGENALRPKLGNDAIDFVVARDVPMTTLTHACERELAARELHALGLA
jgi:hypothetical protein